MSTKPFPALEGRRVLVTGARGFIGTHLCRRLINGGAEVHGVSRRSLANDDGPVKWWRTELSEPEEVRGLVQKVSPEIVIHLASHVAGGRGTELVLPTFHGNLSSTVNLLMAATEAGCDRFVLAGSLEEPETSEAVPSSPYAAAKSAASGYARMFHLLYDTPAVIARIFMVYGPGQRDTKKLVPYVARCLLRREPPELMSGTRPVDWIYVDDVAEGLIRLGTTPGLEGMTVDLGSGELVTVREVVETMARITGSNVEPKFGALEDRKSEQVRVADRAATSQRLHWEPAMSLEDGLRTAVAWYWDHQV